MALRRDPEKRMKLSGHLRELRKRLFRSAFAILAGTIVGWELFNYVFEELQKPILKVAQRS
jgi:sec-independent protein translocase protein TatC